MPVIKYSTARSGLLKAARSARTTCSRSKPISQICVGRGRDGHFLSFLRAAIRALLRRGWAALLDVAR
jgi:hypothetical protein